MIRTLLFICILFVSNIAFCQLQLDTLGWRSPVDIPIYLSGNFAELRSGHFHAGIDIKTQGKEGFLLHAVQDGYISRIKVTPGGYGKAIYINHPDGYTSVYGHMQDYNIQLDRYVKSEQYKKQSYSVDIFPEKGELPVNKGDIIGLSGNSGGSAGPHLHFEIRETKSSKPLNGLFLGFDIEDNIPPTLYYLYTYPQGQQSAVNGERGSTAFSLRKYNGKYTIKGPDTLLVSGELGLGLKVNEYLNNSQNRCGVYVLNVWVNNELYLQEEYDKFSFAETRYINSLMDYEANVSQKRKLYKLYREPNNHLSIYKKEINRGVIKGEPDQVKQVRIEAIDASGNKSELEFYLKFAKPLIKMQIANNQIVIPWEHAYSFDSAGIKLNFLPKTFYDTINMSFSVNEKRYPGTFSPVYTVHNEYVPAHKYFNIEIKCDSVDSILYSKLVLARVVKNDFICAGGYFYDGKVAGKVRNLGKYVIVIDSVAPSIIPLDNLESKTDLSGVKQLRFKIDDEFSGIKNYTGTINGNWVLFEWDPKNKLITYNADEYMPSEGFCEFELRVIDDRGNQTVFKREYEIYPAADHDIGQ